MRNPISLTINIYIYNIYTNSALVSLLKDEHLRLARDFQQQFWQSFPKSISSSSEHALRSWLESVLHIIDRDNKQWVKVRHRKLVNACPDYIDRCRDFTPGIQLSMEEDLKYVMDAFHVKHNLQNVTCRRRNRRKNIPLSNSPAINIDEDLLLECRQSSQVEGDGSPMEGGNTGTERTQPDIDVSNDRLEGKFVSENVINLSKRVLSKAEISVLSKGLKFCPTAKEIDRSKLKEDLEKFGRRMRLKWHFRDLEEDFSINPFKKRSTFNPKHDSAIEVYLSVIEQQIMDIEEGGSNFSNLSFEEREALKGLRNDSEIIIKSADKGSGVVVWDREDYLKEADSQLSDHSVYEKIDYDPSSELLVKISDCINKIRDREEMDPDTLEFFHVDNPKLGRFYLLPKIHKRLKNVPGRPVISNSGYFTENISAFLDYHLQPLAKEVKSYIKDTNDFLKKLRDLPDLPSDAIFCTIDVVGLYPNIPHEDGLEALRKSLDSRDSPKISTDTLMDLAELVLKNNFFTHNEETYHQKSGTAIGTKFAPSYAIITMGDFEEKALDGAELKPWLWWRYIDDIFMVWEHGEESLLEFITYLNNLHPTIKFTYKYSRESIEFLDVLVIRDGSGISTDLFVKDTDTHQYLDFTSCHTFHTKKGIPYGQALRIRRIVSDDHVFQTRCNDLRGWLSQRGFPDALIEEQIGKATGQDRNALLDTVRQDNKGSRDVLVLSYHPCLSRRVHDIVRNAHPILQCDLEHRKVFPEIPMVSYRRAKSLQDILVRAKVPKEQAPLENGCRGCNGRSDCKACGLITPDTHFRSNVTGKSFAIRGGPYHCNSANCVYLLECKTCGIQYVGSSGTDEGDNRFRLRANDYRSKHKKYSERKAAGTLSVTKSIEQAALHAHFAQSDHNGFHDFTFKIIDSADNLAATRKKESYWQYKLKTFLPYGLNERNVSTI